MGYNNPGMIKIITSILRHACELDPTKPVVVGVSGGPDSMCLLDIVHKAGYPLLVACLNHGLRPEAAAEVELVHHTAAALGAPFATRTVDTLKFAEKASLSIEAAARQLRYEFLFSEAVRINAQAVAVGHTADDQAETILMHLMRGSGLAGLKGMDFHAFLSSWSAEIPLVRPLLTTWRSEILAYCQQHQLITTLDATNQSQDYFRNQIRLEILPYLAAYQPNIRQNLVRMANTLSADYALLHSLVETAWQTCLVEDGPGYVAFHRRKVLELPVATQRDLLRKAMLLKRAGVQDVEFAMIERARHHLVVADGSKTYDIGAGLQLRIEQDIAWIVGRDVDLPCGAWPELLTAQAIELSIPGFIELEHGWVLLAHLEHVGAAQVHDLDCSGNSHCSNDFSRSFSSFGVKDIHENSIQDHYLATFDADRLVFPLYIRHRLPGDRLQPAGMHGKTVKLSDLMINLKLPARSRRTWPLVCSGEQIIWVPGCRQSYLAQPDTSTQRVVRLHLTRAA